jgi:1-acyl-sn-glycerol-3-phosphate acyltransferase
MRRAEILPHLNSIWRVPIILLATGILSTFSVVFSLLDGSGRLQHACARRWADFIFFVSRVQVEVEGLENLNPNRGYVFAANHLSMFDHWAFLSHIPFQVRFAAKASLFRTPFLGWHLRRSGNIPIEKANPRKTIQSFQQVSEKIQQGVSFVIYPEGMRTFDGEMVEFRRGAFLLARFSESPIVPVTIIGAHRRLPRGSIVIRPGRMKMIIHAPLSFSDYKEMELGQLARTVHEKVLSSYQQV